MEKLLEDVSFDTGQHGSQPVHIDAAYVDGAKLTGAGGGGAVIALAPGRTEEVLRRWRSLGCYGFLTVVGT